jgi:hypothetical protein
MKRVIFTLAFLKTKRRSSERQQKCQQNSGCDKKMNLFRPSLYSRAVDPEYRIRYTDIRIRIQYSIIGS